MSGKRFRVIDIAKGLGIILVILGHSLKQTEVDAKWIRILICLIYSFHMPLFFVLSGFLAHRILYLKNYQERRRYLGDRAFRLLVPYFVIGLMYIPVKLKLGRYAVKPFRARDIILILAGRNPDVSLWFLYVLFAVTAITVLFVSETNFRSVLYGAGALCAASWWVNIPIRTPKYLFFFLAGIWLRLKYEDLRKAEEEYLFEGQTVIAFLAGIVFLVLNRYYYRTSIRILLLGASVCGIYATLWFSELLLRRRPDSRLVRVLEQGGVYSMDIYILHEPVMTLAKLLLYTKLGMNYIAATLLIFLCAILIPVPVSRGIIRKVPVLRMLLLGIREKKEKKESA